MILIIINHLKFHIEPNIGQINIQIEWKNILKKYTLKRINGVRLEYLIASCDTFYSWSQPKKVNVKNR